MQLQDSENTQLRHNNAYPWISAKLQSTYLVEVSSTLKKRRSEVSKSQTYILFISPVGAMTDTPNLPLSLDPREQPILESLTKIREDLTRLKQDRTTYIKSSDVLDLYDRVVKQVQDLNEVRADKPQEQNRGWCLRDMYIFRTP